MLQSLLKTYTLGASIEHERAAHADILLILLRRVDLRDLSAEKRVAVKGTRASARTQTTLHAPASFPQFVFPQLGFALGLVAGARFPGGPRALELVLFLRAPFHFS
mgnify:CR=1 FL=1